MSEYGTNTTIKRNALHSLLSRDPAAEKKAARRKVLEKVAQKRRESYKRFLEKAKLQASRILDTC